MKKRDVVVGMTFLSLLCIGLVSCVSSSSIYTSSNFKNQQISIEDSLIFSSYYGGDSYYSGDDRAAHTCVGPDGSIYVIIYTDTESWGTIDAYHDSYQGGESDIVLLKLSSDGSQMLYCTYLGGDGKDFPIYMEVDDSDNVYITGMTNSSNLATSGAYDESHNGGDDIFVIKFNPTDNEIIYTTYIGGNEDDEVSCLRVDSSGNVYLTGRTESPNFPLEESIDNTLNGTEDAFIVMIGPDGDELLFSSYLGGNLGECGNDLMIGQDSSIFITGWTSSPDFYTSQFAFDRTLNGTRDGFLINLASDGSEIQFSTLIGGISSDECSYSVIDAEGSCYITGWTRSRDFPMIGGLQPERGGESDCFILKLNDNGSDVLYSSFLGGFDDDSPRGLAIDTWGCVYIVGGTNSDDFPMANAFDEELDGELNVEFSIDCFISKLDLSTNRLLYSSYLGGNSNDDPEGIALDASSNIILCGMTNAEDFPVTANSHQSEFMGGAMDAFLSILYDWGDMDNDLLAECQENILETDRANNDTDSDLLPDGYEVANELDPNNPNDALLDHDNDGLTTYFEFTIGTDPRNQDSDFDTYPDGWEVANGYPPDDDNVSLREVIHYNIPLIILVSFTVIGLYAAYRFRDTFTHKKEEPILDDKEETLKAFEELTGDLPPTELVAKELLKPDVASLEVNVEHFRLLEQDVTRLEEIEEVLESSVKLSLVNSGAEPADIQEITVDFLTKDRSSLDSVELEVLIELERLIDLPPPKEILRLLEARRRLELELDELGGLKEE